MIPSIPPPPAPEPTADPVPAAPATAASLRELWLPAPDGSAAGYPHPVLGAALAFALKATTAAHLGRYLYGGDYPEWVHADHVAAVNASFARYQADKAEFEALLAKAAQAAEGA